MRPDSRIRTTGARGPCLLHLRRRGDHTLPLYITGPLGSNGAATLPSERSLSLRCCCVLSAVSPTLAADGRFLIGAALCAVATLATAFVDSVALVVALRLVLGVAEPPRSFVASFAAPADLAPPSRMVRHSATTTGLYLGLPSVHR